ncbi:hypothetical protein Vadar_011088 [Vaccinium darrowii]|uniref:Uncharacterized protein n=1 Tax=Vaccinium darrowii TaxID=229202 RepID=A0ACB7YKY9_9ERIC|nr:hypothetical protein Vadar_011088 [Vaccinium darrowii]
MGFMYIQTLEIKRCDSLRYVFAPTVTKSIPQLRELKIQRCKTLSRIVAEENGLGDGSVDEVEFPQLESLDLCELPNLVSFFPNVNATLAKSTDQLHNTMRPQPLFNKKVAFPRLEKLYLKGLPNLSDLWCSEVSLPNLEVLEVSKLENLERLGPLSVGTLFKLRRFSVSDCGKLLCVFPSQLAPRLRNVEELTVERCNLLEVVFELEGVDCNEPNPELLSSLKVVKLRDLPILNYISKRDPMGFKYIQTLEIKDCDNLRYLFAPTVTKSISQLRELKIWRCKMLSRIVTEENGMGESLVDEVKFPQLESLELCDLPNFMSFFLNVNTTLPESTDRLHNPMQPQSLFNDKVVIPSLKHLKLLGLENVSELWCSKLQRSSFSKLEKLEVSNCASLRNMFHPSMAKCLVNLKELLIEDCSTLEAVVGKEEEVGGHERKIHKVEFPQLESLDLRDVPNLVSLFPNVNIGLPESADCLHNPMQPQSLFNEKVAIPSLKYLKLLGLKYVSDLWCSKLPSSSFSKLEKLTVVDCASLRNIFHPSMAEGLVNVKELVIEDCSTLEVVVGKEEEVEGGHGIKIDKTLFPQLGKLHLRSLPNLRMFCHFTYHLELPLLSEMAILLCSSMDVFSLGGMSTPNLSLSSLREYGDLINAKQLLGENGDDPMATRMGKPRTLDYVTDKSKSREVAETQCRLVAMPERIDGAHKVARLLYTNSGDGVLALACNGSMRLWKWGRSEENPTGKATATVVPQQWKPASGLAMTNDVTGAKLEAAVPCIVLSKNDSYVISACGGVISLFDMMTFKVMRTFMPPPPASTFLAFHPQYKYNDVIAIGMEDSTIRIYNRYDSKVISTLEGHQKRITGLAFSTNLNILVSSGADAQLCIWSIDTWKKLKSVPIQLPAGKARNGDTRVQFHSNQIYLLVSHETQLAIYDPSRDRICQCVSQDVLLAPISSAAYSCDNQLIYTSFCDGNIGVFDADSLTLRCRIATSAYLSPILLSGNQAVYPLVIAAHPQLPNQFAIGLTDGSVIVMEPPTITWQDSGTTSSSNASNQTPDQNHDSIIAKPSILRNWNLLYIPALNSLISARLQSVPKQTLNFIPKASANFNSFTFLSESSKILKPVFLWESSVFANRAQKGEDVDVDEALDKDIDEDLDKDVDEDTLITTRMRTATTSTHDEEKDLEEVRHYIHSSFLNSFYN